MLKLLHSLWVRRWCVHVVWNRPWNNIDTWCCYPSRLSSTTEIGGKYAYHKNIVWYYTCAILGWHYHTLCHTLFIVLSILSSVGLHTHASENRQESSDCVNSKSSPKFLIQYVQIVHTWHNGHTVWNESTRVTFSPLLYRTTLYARRMVPHTKDGLMPEFHKTENITGHNLNQYHMSMIRWIYLFSLNNL